MSRRHGNHLRAHDRFEIGIDDQNFAAHRRGDFLKERTARRLVCLEEFSLRTRLANTRWGRRPVDIEDARLPMERGGEAERQSELALDAVARTHARPRCSSQASSISILRMAAWTAGDTLPQSSRVYSNARSRRRARSSGEGSGSLFGGEAQSHIFPQTGMSSFVIAGLAFRARRKIKMPARAQDNFLISGQLRGALSAPGCPAGVLNCCPGFSATASCFLLSGRQNLTRSPRANIEPFALVASTSKVCVQMQVCRLSAPQARTVPVTRTFKKFSKNSRETVVHLRPIARRGGGLGFGGDRGLSRMHLRRKGTQTRSDPAEGCLECI
jgi:hypothetical protein